MGSHTGRSAADKFGVRDSGTADTVSAISFLRHLHLQHRRHSAAIDRNQFFTKPPRFHPTRAFELRQASLPRRRAGAGSLYSDPQAQSFQRRHLSASVRFRETLPSAAQGCVYLLGVRTRPCRFSCDPSAPRPFRDRSAVHFEKANTIPRFGPKRSFLRLFSVTAFLSRLRIETKKQQKGNAGASSNLRAHTMPAGRFELRR